MYPNRTSNNQKQQKTPPPPCLSQWIAVQQGNEEWAKEVMLETWQEYAKGVGTKVKVDCPLNH